MKKEKKIALVGNSEFSLTNYRSDLIQYLIEEGHQISAYIPMRDSGDDLKKFGRIRVEKYHITPKSYSIASELKSVLDLGVRLYKFRPNIILSYTAKPNIYVSILKFWIGATVICNVTGLGQLKKTHNNLKNLLINIFYRKMLKNADHVIFQNRSDYDEMDGPSIKNSHIVIGSGVNLTKWKPNITKNNFNGSINFSMISRMLPSKGYVEFIRAAERIIERGHKAEFHLYGSVDDKSDLENIKSILSNKTRITYHGFVENVGEIIDQSDCIVLPSYYPEGTPMILLQAAAKGKPIITTLWSGCEDTVDEGKSGFLVEPKSVESLAAALEQFMSLTRQERVQMGFNSRIKAEELFDVKEIIDLYLGIINAK